MNLLDLFLVFLRSSALAVGGLGSLPLLRQDLVLTGYATDNELIRAIAIGRLSTGPSGLYVVSLGYFVAGWAGAALATVAATLPPLALVPAVAILRKQVLSTWFAGLVRGVSLATAGLLAAVGVQLLLDSDSTAWWQLLLLGAGIALMLWKGTHPALLILAAAAGGLLLGR